MDFQHFVSLKISVEGNTAMVAFNAPKKANALDMPAWEEIAEAFKALDETPSVRAIVLSGEGKHFCSGIDLSLLAGIQSYSKEACRGRGAEKVRQLIVKLQGMVNAIENCRKPVIACIRGGCLGGGLDIAAAADFRYCTADAFFSIREVDMGLVADLGSLQRLPHIIGEGATREMAFTGKNVDAAEALAIGLVNNTFASEEEMMGYARKTAAAIASKSPITVRGIKNVMNRSRGKTVEDGLSAVADWNAAMLLSNDLQESVAAFMQKRSASFED